MSDVPESVTAPMKRITLGWGSSCFISSYSAKRSFLLVSGELSDTKEKQSIGRKYVSKDVSTKREVLLDSVLN